MGSMIAVLGVALLSLDGNEEAGVAAAEQEFRSGHYLASLKTLKSVELGTDPAASARALELKAECLWALGDAKGSLECFSKLSESRPSCALSLEGVGRGLLALGKLEKAHEVLSRAAELAPQDVAVLCSLSRLHSAREDLGAAEEALLEAADYAPRDARVAAARVDFLLADEAPAEALAAAKAFGATTPDGALGPCLEGRVHRHSGANEAALAAYRQAVERDEGCVEAHEQLALLGHELTSRGVELVDATQHHYNRYFELGGRDPEASGRYGMWIALRARPEDRAEAQKKALTKKAKKKALTEKAAKKKAAKSSGQG